MKRMVRSSKKNSKKNGLNTDNSQLLQCSKILSEKIPNLVAIYLYGSLASGTGNEESDIDLGVLARVPVESTILYQTRLELLGAVDRSVDIVDMRKIPLTLGIEILKNHQFLFKVDDVVVNFFETTLMSMYAELNEARASIMNDIVKRGSVRAR